MLWINGLLPRPGKKLKKKKNRIFIYILMWLFLSMRLVKSCVRTSYTDYKIMYLTAYLLETFEPVSSRRKATVGDYTIFYFDSSIKVIRVIAHIWPYLFPNISKTEKNFVFFVRIVIVINHKLLLCVRISPSSNSCVRYLFRIGI